jgi:uncharacterized DUF497 family protein
MGREYEFRWNSWNIGHIAEHGVTPQEAESVVRTTPPPFPEAQGRGRFLAVGQTKQGTYIQVAYIFSPADVVFVIHSRPLNDAEKRRFRRRIR